MRYGLAGRAALIDILDHDDTGLDSDAEQSQEAYSRRDTEIGAGQIKRKDAPNGSHRNGQQYQESPFERIEHRIQNQENDQNGNGYDDRQPGLRSLLTFIFARPVEVVSGRKHNLCAYSIHRLLDCATEIAAANAVLDRNI